MVRPDHQDRAIPGIFHHALHESADREAAALLRERHTHHDQVKLAAFDFLHDLVLRVSNSDFVLSGYTEHLEAFYTARHKSFHTLTLIIILEIPTQRCE